MADPKKIVSWNVNGLRAALKKGLLNFVKSENADVYCFQEIKTNDAPLELEGAGYDLFLNPARKSGYSGTLTLTRVKPKAAFNGMGIPEFDEEGRVQVLEFDTLYVVNSYFPNAQHGLTRLGYKLKFDAAFAEFAEKLRSKKPLITCGDFNVAHQEIDIARPKDNEGNAGFTQEERNWMSEFLKKGYVDTFRLFVKDGGHYSWWSYRFNAREKNIGWRIDYFLVSSELLQRVLSSTILDSVDGSDHAPVELVIKDKAREQKGRFNHRTTRFPDSQNVSPCQRGQD